MRAPRLTRVSEGKPARRYSVRFVLPSGWRAVTPWKEAGEAFVEDDFERFVTSIAEADECEVDEVPPCWSGSGNRLYSYTAARQFSLATHYSRPKEAIPEAECSPHYRWPIRY